MFRVGVWCLLVGCGSSGSGPLPRVSGGVRLILTQDLIAKLQKRAQANDPNWTALKAKCDALSTGKVIPPSGDAYPSAPDIGAGYAGEEYLPALYALGLCYRVGTGADAMKWGTQGAALVDAMATPESSGGYKTAQDSGYAIRNFGVGIAFGYDWLYPALSSDQRKRAADALAAWIDFYDKSGFIHDQPIGNYFEGYFLAKVAGTFALMGDLPEADRWWLDLTTRMWPQLVQPAFSTSMAGGGWPEGWQYGPRSVEEVVQALRCATTAKQLDWEKQLPEAHDQAAYQLQFSWPSLVHMDDQGTVRSGSSLAPNGNQAFLLAGLLDQQGDPFAPTAHGFAQAIAQANPDQKTDEWIRFLFDDPSAASAPVAMQPLSYFAPGSGQVAMRSSWDAGATWASFVSGPYIDSTDSGEQLYNQGAVALVKSDTPLIVNPSGWVPQLDKNGETAIYDDNYMTAKRMLYNAFFVDDSANSHNPGQSAIGPDTAKTHVERYEDGATFVRARGAGLEQMYAGGVIKQWMRDVVFLRPDALVVYDRTTVNGAGNDRWLSFHLPSMPSANGSNEWDVAGQVSLVSVMPAVTAKLVALPVTSVTRVELHSRVGVATDDWLTVAIAGPSLGTTQVQVSGWNGVDLGGNRHRVVLFPSDHAGQAMATSASYGVTQADGDHLLLDFAAGSYAVTATAAAGTLMVNIASGGSFSPSKNGTLAFKVAQDGTVSK